MNDPKVITAIKIRYWNTPIQLYYQCLRYSNDFIDQFEPMNHKGDGLKVDGYEPSELDFCFTHLDDGKRLFEKSIEKGDIFLDLGCGFGNMLWLAIDQGASEAYGVEIVPERVNTANEILRNPELALGGKDEDGLFKHLSIDKSLFPREVVEGYDKCLENACDLIKNSKIFIRKGDIFESTPEVDKANLIYFNASKIIDPWKNRELKENRIKILQDKLSKSKAKVITVGLEIPDKKLLNEIEWTSGGMCGPSSTKVRIYE